MPRFHYQGRLIRIGRSYWPTSQYQLEKHRPWAVAAPPVELHTRMQDLISPYCPLSHRPYSIFGQGCQILRLVYISQPALLKDKKNKRANTPFFLQLEIEIIFFTSRALHCSTYP
jgi:hypothetical protein